MKLTLYQYFLPKNLMGQSVLILVIPLIVVQLVVGLVFYDRLFHDVTIKKVGEISRQIKFLLNFPNKNASASLGFSITKNPPIPQINSDNYHPQDFTALQVFEALRANFKFIYHINLDYPNNRAKIYMKYNAINYLVIFNRDRASARNPHQLLVAMIGASSLTLMIALIFLRNQIRPIILLARAAENFGKGRNNSFSPQGAVEVRNAGIAFLNMKKRIKNYLKQRTLMLSGISHDLCTPLTRMKLSLSLLPETDEVILLQKDVQEMQAIIDEFLTFSRTNNVEKWQIINTHKLITDLMKNYEYAKATIEIRVINKANLSYNINGGSLALQRALSNLINNAEKFATLIQLHLEIYHTEVRFCVEDNGPGIAAADRNRAIQPFTRLDAARNQNKGTGTGLGLVIAADIARNHGGKLTLQKSSALGGLSAKIIIPK